jgi:hypothetical protein
MEPVVVLEGVTPVKKFLIPRGVGLGDSGDFSCRWLQPDWGYKCRYYKGLAFRN